MADSNPDLSKRRLVIWGGLLLLLAAAVVLLLMALSNRRESAPTPTDAPDEVRRPVLVQVVDDAGEPIRHARLFVFQAEDAPQAEAGTWDESVATLSLPFTGEPRAVVAQARGYKTTRVDDIVGDRTIELEPGFLTRFVTTGDAALPAPPVRLYLRIYPAAEDGGALSQEESDTILDLMGVIAPHTEGVPEPPRSGFGLLLTAARAEAGVRVPLAGNYVVKWGFLDEKAGVWQGGYESVVKVEEDAPATRFEVPVTEEAVRLALAKLREEIAKMGDRGTPAPSTAD